MALEITYWSRGVNDNMAGQAISSETRSLSSSSALSGATPPFAGIISILATENARYAYGSTALTATATAGANGHYIASGERIWIPAQPGYFIAGIQAA